MPEKQLPTDELLELLRTHPRRVADATHGIPASDLEAAPDGEWSAVEILAHMRACGDMWGGAIESMLAADHPTIKAINPRRWIESTNYRNQSFPRSFHAFEAQRKRLLTALEPLSPKDWKRGAKVTGAGKPLELTVHSYAQRLAIHERAHVKQIERLVRDR
jgi:hypothetical protein